MSKYEKMCFKNYCIIMIVKWIARDCGLISVVQDEDTVVLKTLFEDFHQVTVKRNCSFPLTLQNNFVE